MKVELEGGPWPVPEMTSVQTYSDGWEWWPLGVRSFAKVAADAGWDHRIGFSRGYVPAVAKDTAELRDIIGVWLDGYGHRAVAWWQRNPDAEFTAKKLEAGVKPGEVPSGMTWKASATAVWPSRSSLGPAFPYLNMTEMEAWLKVRGSVLPAFWDTARHRVLAAREAAAAKSKAGTVKRTVREHA